LINRGLFVLPVVLFVLQMQTVHAHHVSASPASSQSGGIVTISPETLGVGRMSAGVNFTMQDFDPFSDTYLETVSDAGIEDVHSTGSIQLPSISLAYGVTDRLEFSFTLPYVVRKGIREAEHHHGEDHHDDGDDDGDPDEEEGGINMLGKSAGFGDLLAFAKVRLTPRNESGFMASALGGLRMPTGNTKERDDFGNLFETEFQPGTGAWSPMIGLSVAQNWGSYTLSSSALYTVTGTGSQETNLGDSLAYGVALAYRMGRGSHAHADASSAHGHSGWDLILELVGEWQEMEKIKDELNEHSGGTLLFVAPGLRYNAASGWAGYASVGIPVLEHLNGIQNKTDLRLNMGFSFSW
jgi:hypothetical protein